MTHDSSGQPPFRVLFVCLGNICRSPTAEGVFRGLLEEAGLGERVEVDSAGTTGWHAGERPHPETRRAAARRGHELTSRARVCVPEDGARFDLLVAMDRSNLADVRRIVGPEAAERVVLFRDFGPRADHGLDVPDPYGGAAGGFEEVLDICERAARGLLDHLRRDALR